MLLVSEKMSLGAGILRKVVFGNVVALLGRLEGTWRQAVSWMYASAPGGVDLGMP